VAPYRDILGGKLVALLSVSPTVVCTYKNRYQRSASVIASSMAGRRIIRKSGLVYVGTTSLYGVRPNQYERASVPGRVVGAHSVARFGFKFIGDTQGYGTSQFGESTKDALERLTSMARNGKGVNNVFGEGANPRLRALREGISVLGLPKELLVHGMSKAVYGVSMLERQDLCDYLLGLISRPKYVFSTDAVRSDVSSISAYWFSRWVSPRAEREDVLDKIRTHNLIYPIRHGARLSLPDADVDQLEFFREQA
jgi:hypothetical protein